MTETTEHDGTATDAPTASADDGGRAGPAWLGRGWARPIVLAAALAFLAGGLGYLLGDAQAEVGDVPAGRVDTGFLVDMADHHEQAVTMALYASEHATDPSVRNFAREVIIFQRYELGLIDAFLGQRGLERPAWDPDRETMAWMGQPTPLSSMAGVASEEQMAALRDARGVEADLLFLDLMTAHHEGGVSMAQWAALTGETEQVRDLARVMADNQASEIGEYATARARIVAEQADG